MMDWQWWEDALANPREIGGRLKISVDAPQQGFYRTRYKNGPWMPVAIWKDEDGKWIALQDGAPVDAERIWNWCCRNPITSEAYERALSGNGWADDDPSVAKALAMAGHNLGDVSDLDILKDQIESAKQGAEAYADITDDDQAGRAQSLRARMNELAREADKKRDALKRPHLEAGKAIDLEWMPVVKEAKGVADTLRKYIEVFETAKLFERRRLEAERLAREEDAAPPPMEADMVKGNYGRAASIGTEKVVTAVTDQDALYGFMREHPDLKACLLDLARRALKAGHDVPGITYEERAKIS